MRHVIVLEKLIKMLRYAIINTGQLLLRNDGQHLNIMSLFLPQKNVHALQSAVDSLQKEKEELVLALQFAKKDTNQAKYEHFIWFYKVICALLFIT